MFLLLYDFGIRVFTSGIRLVSPFHRKAWQWVRGRRGWRTRLSATVANWADAPVLWMHVSSLGEFEQGRPILEKWREQHPDWRILLTFFSPSGYNVRHNYPHADLVLYLPADTLRNARSFVRLARPSAAIFVKYDFWAAYLHELRRRQVPTLLVSGLFRPAQRFFKWHGGFWRQMLGCFSHFFVQDEASKKLLQNIGFENITVAGDTRVDRVLDLAAQAPEQVAVRRWLQPLDGAPLPPTVVLGSIWEADEQVLVSVLLQVEFRHLRLIVAPHDPSTDNVERLCQNFAADGALRFSELTNGWQPPTAGERIPRVLVIDNVGLLNTLYRYGTLAYIGGGFGKGIHNTLEPAAFGLPVLFGPHHQHFEEARQMVARRGAFCVESSGEVATTLRMLQEPAAYEAASQAVRNYLQASSGATRRVLEWLEQSKLNTH